MLLDRPTTKFENRGLNLDHDIHEYVWRKRETGEAAGTTAEAPREDAR